MLNYVAAVAVTMVVCMVASFFVQLYVYDSAFRAGLNYGSEITAIAIQKEPWTFGLQRKNPRQRRFVQYGESGHDAMEALRRLQNIRAAVEGK